MVAFAPYPVSWHGACFSTFRHDEVGPRVAVLGVWIPAVLRE